MDPILEGRFDAVRKEVSRSRLEPEHKELLQARIDKAARCANGSPDKVAAIADALSDSILHDVREVIRSPDRVESAIDAAIQRHLSGCPSRAAASAEKGVKAWLREVWKQNPTIAAVAFIFAVQQYGLVPVLKWIGAALGFGQ